MEDKIFVKPSEYNCKVGNSYKKKCEGYKVCKPIEGSFTTECEVKGCNKFC